MRGHPLHTSVDGIVCGLVCLGILCTQVWMVLCVDWYAWASFAHKCGWYCVWTGMRGNPLHTSVDGVVCGLDCVGILCTPAHDAIASVDYEEVSGRIEGKANGGVQGSVFSKPTIASVLINHHPLVILVNGFSNRGVTGHCRDDTSD